MNTIYIQLIQSVQYDSFIHDNLATGIGSLVFGENPNDHKLGVLHVHSSLRFLFHKFHMLLLHISDLSRFFVGGFLETFGEGLLTSFSFVVVASLWPSVSVKLILQ